MRHQWLYTQWPRRECTVCRLMVTRRDGRQIVLRYEGLRVWEVWATRKPLPPCKETK